MTQLPPTGLERQEAPDAATNDAVGATLPVGFRATSDEEGFALLIKARPRWAGFLGIFALFWNGFMVVWFAIAFSTGQWGMALAGLLHGTVGVIVGYLAVRGIFNRIELTVRRGVLAVRHRPLPWLVPPPMRREDIDQLYVQEDRSLEINHRPVLRYALQLKARSGREHQLAILDELEQARYLEREIERAFAIEDRQVTDELPKGP